MRILVNAHAMGGGFAGVGRYARSLYREIESSNAAEVFYFHHGKATRGMPETAPVGQRVPPIARYWLRRIQGRLQERALARAVRSVTPDVYHETALVPLRPPQGLPMVATVFDLSLQRFPGHHPADRVKYFRRYFGRRLARTQRIITISEFTRRELLSLYPVEPGRVSAIPLAPDSAFRRRSEGEVRRFLDAQQIVRPYLLAVGTLEPRKNLLVAARATAALKTPLVVAGREGWLGEEAMRELRALQSLGSVRLLGQVPDDELALLYSGAGALVYPSVYEGFGLPVLEAMACGCPVVASNGSAITEAAGDAALLVDPGDAAAVAGALARVLGDTGFRAALIERAYEHSRRFNWGSTASSTIGVFERAISGAAP